MGRPRHPPCHKVVQGVPAGDVPPGLGQAGSARAFLHLPGKAVPLFLSPLQPDLEERARGGDTHRQGVGPGVPRPKHPGGRINEDIIRFATEGDIPFKELYGFVRSGIDNEWKQVDPDTARETPMGGTMMSPVNAFLIGYYYADSAGG